MVKKLVIIIAIIGLFLFGCIQTGAVQPVQYVCSDGKTIVTNLSLCSDAATPSSGTGVSTGSASRPALTLDTELEVCSGMPSTQQGSLEEACILGVAAKHQNLSLCKRLSYGNKMNCYLTIATLTNNPETCKEAGTDKDSCYQQYASTTKDATVCDKITDVNYKGSCYSNLAGTLGDASLCGKIVVTPQKDSCYFNIAMYLQSSTYCSQIMNENQKQNCLKNLQSSGPSQQPLPQPLK